MKNKIIGTLGMAAYGDALGSVTENLPFDVIREKFNGGVTEFMKPGETAFALGNEAGQVTDDFSQIYFLNKNILENDGVITKDVVIKTIIDWSEMPHYFNRFAGPTTRSAIKMYQTGDFDLSPLPGAVTVDYASKATNGSAMKIAPAGIFNPGNIDKAIEDAVTITRVTHDNSLAISGAAAVAASVSKSLEDNCTFDDLLTAGIYGAIEGEKIGKSISKYVAGPSVVERMKFAIEIAEENLDKESKLRKLYDIIGSGLHISEAVPCAYGIIAMNKDNPYQAVIDAVNIGYDTDTIATIVGSIVGALVKADSKLFEIVDFIDKANDMKITDMVDEILTKI